MKTHQLPNGLTDRQVLESRQKYGINILTPPKKLPWWVLFQEKFSDPLIKILMMAGVLSVGISIYEYFGLKEGGQVFFEPVGIFIAILLATGLAFYYYCPLNILLPPYLRIWPLDKPPFDSFIGCPLKNGC